LELDWDSDIRVFYIVESEGNIGRVGTPEKEVVTRLQGSPLKDLFPPTMPNNPMSFQRPVGVNDEMGALRIKKWVRPIILDKIGKGGIWRPMRYRRLKIHASFHRQAGGAGGR
jgi:hypothetical protein